MNEIKEFAPAKINLYLHITGRRADGYHDLDSLVAFASVGDEVRLYPAAAFSFAVEGAQAALLAHENGDDNLVAKAARSLAELTGNKLDVRLVLDKKLPVASGIGGGSSDAAAALRALARHWRLKDDDARLAQAAARHGQDVPVCLKIESTYMTAAGVETAPRLPRADVVLVNPNKALSTPAAYKEFREGGYGFSPAAQLARAPENLEDLVTEMAARRNDFYPAACRLMPEVANVVAAIEATRGCLLARMSGSGATCFGIYTNADAAAQAAAALRAAHPGWWVEAGVTL